MDIEIRARVLSKNFPQAEALIEKLFDPKKNPAAGEFDGIEFTLRKEKGAGCSGTRGEYWTGEVS